ncbi:MAG: PhzF family phenazine biosynthesis protein [Nocardioides sp.]
MPPDQLAFDIVDVFAESPYAGNQLAVVHGADHLSDGQRQAVAREFGYSETTFPSPRGAAEYAVRILTPSLEIAFAGHPTLGTAWVLRERGDLDADVATQHCAVGPVALRLDGDRVELTATPRDLAGPVPERLVLEVLADHGLGPDDLAGPAWVAGAGLDFLHVPVTEEGLLRARIGIRGLDSYDGWPPLLDRLDAVNLVALTSGAPGEPVAVHARVFVPGLIDGAEDAATGSAAAGLGMMLAASGLLPDGGRYEIRQGSEMGRPSHLSCRVEAVGGVPSACRVAGRVQPIARGTIAVPPA